VWGGSFAAAACSALRVAAASCSGHVHRDGHTGCGPSGKRAVGLRI